MPAPSGVRALGAPNFGTEPGGKKSGCIVIIINYYLKDHFRCYRVNTKSFRSCYYFKKMASLHKLRKDLRPHNFGPRCETNSFKQTVNNSINGFQRRGGEKKRGCKKEGPIRGWFKRFLKILRVYRKIIGILDRAGWGGVKKEGPNRGRRMRGKEK